MKRRIVVMALLLPVVSARAQVLAPSSAPWKVQNYQLEPLPIGNGLDLSTPPYTEEITVYAKRQEKSRSSARISSLDGGSATLSGLDDAHMAGFTGMTVTASFPIKAVPGLAATMNLSGGHDTSNPAASPAAAAVTAGIKLDF